MTSLPPPAPSPVAVVTAPPPDPPELPEGVQPTPVRPRWRPWTAWAALVSGFAGALVGALVVGIVAIAFGDDFEDPAPAQAIVGTVLQDFALIAAAVIFARMAGSVRPWQLGLRPPRGWRSAVGWMLLTFLAFYAFSIAWVALLGLDEPTDLPDELGTDSSSAALIAVCVLVTVIAPVAEEIFFRGYFFTALRNWRGVWPAAILTGVVFGAIHTGSAPAAFLLPLAVLGALLCLLYVRTRSLLPCIVLHSLNNSIALGASEHWDWQIAVLAASALATIALLVFMVRRIFGPAPVLASP